MSINENPDTIESIKLKLAELQSSVQQCQAALGAVRQELRAIRDAKRIEFSSPLDPQRFADSKRLLKFQQQVSSQNGEDGMIHEIFRRIGTTDRIFAEVGVGDGSENNTAFLFSQGWTGYWVDGGTAFMQRIQQLNGASTLLRGCQGFVDRENIAGIFQTLGVPIEFDFLSLDIDQNTYYLWEGLASYRPRVVAVEYNAALPADVDWKVHYDPKRQWNGSQNFGASLKAFDNLARKRGYSLVGCDFTGVNAFFVRDDLLGDHFCSPYTPENHIEPPRYSQCLRWSHRNEILDRIE